MFDAVKDVIAQSVLPFFDELLWEWTNVIERTVRMWHQTDVPWWYNERASLSLFAGAVWKAGGIAFEEFSSTREGPNSEEAPMIGRRMGRIDLCFTYQGTRFVTEAKQCWSPIGSRAGSARAEIERMLQQASADVLTAPEYYGRRLALVFASPYFPQSEFGVASERLVQWKQVVESVDSYGKAFYWLHDCQWTVDEGYLYPGAAIFIRQAAAEA